MKNHHTQATINNPFNTFSSFCLFCIQAKMVCLTVYIQGGKTCWITVIVRKSDK